MTNLQAQIELISSNKEVQQGIKNMLVKLRQANKKGTDWCSLDEVEDDHCLNSSKTLAIELVPAWATLESLDTTDLVDLYDDYYNTNSKDESELNWKNLDVKIILLDSEAHTSETLQVFWIGEQGIIEYL